MFLTVLGIALAILLALIFNPAHLWEHRWKFNDPSAGLRRARDYNENRERNQKMAEIDRLLDKVAREGVDKLSRPERKKLDALSHDVYGRK